jgi:ParB-like chromosome segregation protein Spo0J
MDLPPLPSDLYDRLREDIRLRGIQIPILVDNATGEVIDGKQRKQIAHELGIRDVPTIFVGRLTPSERADLRLAVNVYRRHLSRAQMREMIAWTLREQPDASDRSIAGQTGASHPTVARVRSELEAGGTIYHLPDRTGRDGKKYPAAAKPTVYAASSSEGRRAKSLLDRLGDDAPPRPASIRVLHKLLNRKEREALKSCPDAELPAHIKIECCDFRDLALPDGSVDLIFTDPPWDKNGRRLIPEFARWAATKLRPDGGLLLLYTGHAGLLEVGSQIARKLTYLWTLSCHNGDGRGTSTRHDLHIRCCWRPILMFCRGAYCPRQVFDDAVISEDREKAFHDYQQPMSEAVFFIKSLTRPKAVICDPFLGSGTTACAVARLGQGRRFLGAEIDAGTCRIARNRVAQELRTGLTTAVPKAAVSQ